MDVIDRCNQIRLDTKLTMVGSLPAENDCWLFLVTGVAVTDIPVRLGDADRWNIIGMDDTCGLWN